MRRETDDGDGYYHLGKAYGGLGDYDMAIDAFSRALELDPTSSDTQYFMAVALEHKGRMSEASDAYLRAVES